MCWCAWAVPTCAASGPRWASSPAPSAIGNTTNLAARLQSLTRELDAALVIDATTWQRAEAAAASFERRSAVPIRGRRETQDLYALPLRATS